MRYLLSRLVSTLRESVFCASADNTKPKNNKMSNLGAVFNIVILAESFKLYAFSFSLSAFRFQLSAFRFLLFALSFSLSAFRFKLLSLHLLFNRTGANLLYILTMRYWGL